MQTISEMNIRNAIEETAKNIAFTYDKSGVGDYSAQLYSRRDRNFFC